MSERHRFGGEPKTQVIVRAVQNEPEVHEPVYADSTQAPRVQSNIRVKLAHPT